jgi:hypothetical protein
MIAARATSNPRVGYENDLYILSVYFKAITRVE